MDTKECYICGCTEENPCMTEGGTCSWAFSTRKGHVCTACIVLLEPEPTRERFPNDSLIVEKVCRNCGHLHQARITGMDSYTCGMGRFDSRPPSSKLSGIARYFALSGIKRPNKTVAIARRSCKTWEIHDRYKPKIVLD